MADAVVGSRDPVAWSLELEYREVTGLWLFRQIGN